MRRALALARRGWGTTSPNPMVGAVFVARGEEIAGGWHVQAGGPHAEIAALADLDRRGHAGLLPESTLYVTLEPCSTTGRTPPCTAALLARRPARIVVGMVDPNPRHAGRGLAILQEAGIPVTAGVEEARCRELNAAFCHWMATGRPFVLLKLAMTLDGRIATADGQSQWITGPTARARVQRLRQWADAILVGGETARRDHPSLTVRTRGNDWRQPRRLVATRHLDAAALAALMPPGSAPEPVCAETPEDWVNLLENLGREHVTALLVEGGGELAATLLHACAVDEVELHIAPKLLGGRGSRPAIGGPDPASLAEALALVDRQVRRLGDDLLVRGRPQRPA
jgi:diaminohydroxyphosphoribosylaminopyrimidine deaminase/5-amino-6-(5-phosphoribosylamino)uracil reductase